MPSGLTSVQRMTTSLRMRSVSGSIFVFSAVDRLDQLLRAEHFGGVQAAVDPDHRLAFARERVRLLVGQPSASASLRFASLISGSFRVVLRRRDDGRDSVRPSSVLPISTTIMRSDCCVAASSGSRRTACS